MKPLTKQVVQKINLHNRTKTTIPTKVKKIPAEILAIFSTQSSYRNREYSLKQLLDMLDFDYDTCFVYSKDFGGHIKVDQFDFTQVVNAEISYISKNAKFHVSIIQYVVSNDIYIKRVK